MYLHLNLETFQYIDGFGCYHFCLKRIPLELIFFNFFATFASVLRLQVIVTFGSILTLQVTVRGDHGTGVPESTPEGVYDFYRSRSRIRSPIFE